ncbi:MAG: hypothetical protein ACFFEE_04785 [Candidatus Thorarchaeota archaeon]
MKGSNILAIVLLIGLLVIVVADVRLTIETETLVALNVFSIIKDLLILCLFGVLVVEAVLLRDD